jgi:MFS family permease
MSPKRTVAQLAIAQALGQTFAGMILATTALVGAMLAADKSLATLPHALGWVSVAACAIPASQLMRRLGRRVGFLIGAAIGIVGALIATYGIWTNSFWTFAAGTITLGGFNAINMLYRFAAAEVAPPDWRAKAISYVLAGSLVAGIVGPEIAKHTKDLFAPVSFAGTYLSLTALPILMMLVIAVTPLPRPQIPDGAARRAGRPLAEIARNPKFVVAVLAGMFGWAVMSLMMTATPLAMIACGYHFTDAAFVVQWHILGMYAPSFITGTLIARFGLSRIMLLGALAQFCCIGAALAGVEVWNFWLANVLVGVGWNFLFVTGTALLTETHTAEERAKVQGFNDFVIFGVVATTAFSSGWLQNAYGWETVNVSVVPLILAVIAAALWIGSKRPAASPAE